MAYINNGGKRHSSLDNPKGANGQRRLAECVKEEVPDEEQEKNRPSLPSHGNHDEEDTEQYEVKEIIGIRFRKKKKQYRIIYKYFPERHYWRWEPEESVACCKRMVKEFEHRIGIRESATGKLTATGKAFLTFIRDNEKAIESDSDDEHPRGNEYLFPQACSRQRKEDVRQRRAAQKKKDAAESAAWDSIAAARRETGGVQYRVLRNDNNKVSYAWMLKTEMSQIDPDKLARLEKKFERGLREGEEEDRNSNDDDGCELHLEDDDEEEEDDEERRTESDEEYDEEETHEKEESSIVFEANSGSELSDTDWSDEDEAPVEFLTMEVVTRSMYNDMMAHLGVERELPSSDPEGPTFLGGRIVGVGNWVIAKKKYNETVELTVESMRGSRKFIVKGSLLLNLHPKFVEEKWIKARSIVRKETEEDEDE